MITDKSYVLELWNTIEWVPLGFEYMTGSFDETRVPYLSGTIRARVPGSATQQTSPLLQGVKLRLAARTPGLFEFPFLRIVERTPVTPTLFDLSVVSEEALLDDFKHPGIPNAFYGLDPLPRSWRTHTTLEQLIPAVGAAVGISVSPVMPVAGVKCAPTYEKDQLILNPTHNAGGTGWAAEPIYTAYTPGDGWADFKLKTPAGAWNTQIGGFFHPVGQPPSISPGRKYKVGLRVTAPAEWAGKRLFARALSQRKIGGVVVSSEAHSPYPPHLLVGGVNEAEHVFEVKPGYTITDVGFEVFGAGFMESVPASPLRVTRAWLQPADVGDPAPGVEFFNGDTPDDDDYTYEWEDLPHKSQSYRFPVEERSLESAVQEVGETYWTVIGPHLAKRGWRLHPAPGNTWQVVPTGSTRGAPHTIDRLAYLDARTQLSRASQDWGDGVLLRYRWDTVAGPQERYDTYLWGSSVRPIVVDLAEPFVGFGAAFKYYQAAQRAGGEHQYDLPLDFAFTTGRMINTPQAWPPSTNRDIGAVSKITFDTRADTMTLHIPATAAPI